MARRQRPVAVLGKRELLAIMACGLAISCGSEPAEDTPQSTSETVSDSGSTSISSQTSPTSISDPGALMGSIEFVGVSLDDGSITVRPLPSTDACAAYQSVSDVQATESIDSVMVRVLMMQTVETEDCIEPGVLFDTVTLPLQQPLGGRAVMDAAAPDLPLIPRVAPGQIEVAFRLEIHDGVALGPPATDGAVDVAYVGHVPSVQPVAESDVGGLAEIARIDDDAFTLVMSPSGESIWFGLGRQTPPPGRRPEPRTRDQIVSVELPLAAAPGSVVTGQRVLISLEPGAFTTGEQPSIDPTKISLKWIEPTDD